MSEYDRLLAEYQEARRAAKVAVVHKEEADAAVERAWDRLNDLLKRDSSANLRPARAE